MLREASDRHGGRSSCSRTVVQRIVFDGIDFRSPASTTTHDHIYTYGKTLAGARPAHRLCGAHARLPDREAMNNRILVQQLAAGWAFPNALLQHALGDWRSCRSTSARSGAPRSSGPGAARHGLRGHEPAGHVLHHGALTDPDDLAFSSRLASHGALVLPGTIVESQAGSDLADRSDEMVGRGLEASAPLGPR